MGQFSSLNLADNLVPRGWGLKQKQNICSCVRGFLSTWKHSVLLLKGQPPPSEARAESPGKNWDVTGSKSLTNGAIALIGTKEGKVVDGKM